VLYFAEYFDVVLLRFKGVRTVEEYNLYLSFWKWREVDTSQLSGAQVWIQLTGRVSVQDHGWPRVHVVIMVGPFLGSVRHYNGNGLETDVKSGSTTYPGIAEASPHLITFPLCFSDSLGIPKVVPWGTKIITVALYHQLLSLSRR
jgi:hypothetical protein